MQREAPMSKRVEEAKQRIEEAKKNWNAVKRDPTSTKEERMAAKDRYNQSMQSLAFAVGAWGTPYT